MIAFVPVRKVLFDWVPKLERLTTSPTFYLQNLPVTSFHVQKLFFHQRSTVHFIWEPMLLRLLHTGYCPSTAVPIIVNFFSCGAGKD